MNAAPYSLWHALAGTLLLIIIPILLWGYTRRVRTHKQQTLRPIPAFGMLRGLIGQMAESNKRVHLALGTSGISDSQMSVVAGGLAVLRYLANQGAAFGVSPITTVADPTLMLVAQDILYRAYQERGRKENYVSTDVQMIAPDAMTYAIGAQDIVNQENVAANVMIGHLGEEYLLLGEAGAQRGLIQLAGSNTVNAQPFILSTSRHALLGEEVFAAGAYLTRQPEHIASLHVQDWLRVGIIIVIVAGVLFKTLAGAG